MNVRGVFSTGSFFVQPVGMWLSSLMSDSSAGQVNVPDAATPLSQLSVAPLVQVVNATFIELRDVQF